MGDHRPPIVAFTLRVIEALDLDHIVRVSTRDLVELFGAVTARVIDRNGDERGAHGRASVTPGERVCWRFSLGPEVGLVLELELEPDPDLPILRQQFVDLIAVVRRAATHARVLAAERRAAALDPLTGVSNRRSLHETMEELFARARADATPLSVMLVDLDHFKEVNDAHGHAAGDEVLKSAVACLREQLRVGDHVGRWGGDEFLVVLDGASATQARPVADRLRAAFAHAQAFHGVTMSIGIADLDVLPGEGGTIEALIEQADRCLYESKRGGRNRTSIAA